MSGLDDLVGTFRDVDRLTSSANRTLRSTERAVDGAGRTLGAIKGFGGTVDEAEYRREGRGDRAHLQANRARRALEEDGQNQGQGDPQFTRQAYQGQMGFPRNGGRGQSQGSSLQDELITSIVEASQDPQSKEKADKVRQLAGQMERDSGDDRLHFQGSYSHNINGKDIKINFGRGNSETVYTDPQDAITDVLKRAGLGPIAAAQGTVQARPASYTPEADAPPAPVADPRVQAPPADTTHKADAPAAVPPAGPVAKAAPDAAAPAAEPPAPAADAAAKTQKELNQEAQMYLERMDLSTGGKNTRLHDAKAADADISDQLDGIVGEKTKAALKAKGFDPEKPITAEMVEQLKTKAEAAMAAKRTKTTAVDAPEATPAREIADSPERHAFLQAAAKDAKLAAGLSDQQIIDQVESTQKGRAGVTIDGKLDARELAMSAGLYQDKSNQPAEINAARAALLTKEHIVKQADGTYAEAPAASTLQAAAPAADAAAAVVKTAAEAPAAAITTQPAAPTIDAAPPAPHNPLITMTSAEAPLAPAAQAPVVGTASPAPEAKAAPAAQPAIFFTTPGFAPEISSGVYTPSAEQAKIQQLVTAAAPETGVAHEPSSAGVPMAQGFNRSKANSVA